MSFPEGWGEFFETIRDTPAFLSVVDRVAKEAVEETVYPLPPSLMNIYKELSYEYRYPIPKRNGDLTPWAKQGVLLLNASLTVRKGEPNSHSKYGWDKITDMAISYLDSKDRPIVYLLWGSYANKKAALIHSDKACIIHTAHPSPLSANRGFFCSDCFMRCNDYLISQGMKSIDFRIDETV